MTAILNFIVDFLKRFKDPIPGTDDVHARRRA
jgi:hypothetical protein